MRGLRLGERVRTVYMQGCMAHVRGESKEGVLEYFQYKNVYGGGTRGERYAHIRFDDGTEADLPANSRLWVEHDGLPEYRK